MTTLEIDKFAFQWIKKQLADDATPDQIVAFYVDKFVFHNEGYLEYLRKEYKLSNDILKLHKQIVQLAGE